MQIHVRRSVKPEPIIWIVDSEQWPRALMRAELIERGYDPLGFVGIHDALQAYKRGTIPKPEAIVLESRGQKFTEEVMAEITKLNVPTILMAGDLELNDVIVATHHWHNTLRRPFSIGEVAELVQRCLRNVQ